MSVQSEIDRIKKNVNETLKTISDTGVTVGAGSDSLPTAAAALANEKQDKATAVTVPGSGTMQMSESIGPGPYTIEFDEEADEAFPASLVDYNNTTSGMAATTVQAAVDELFTSVSEGKSLIAAAVTDKGVETAATDSFAAMAEKIGQIELGGELKAHNINLKSTSNGTVYAMVNGQVIEIPSYDSRMVTVYGPSSIGIYASGSSIGLTGEGCVTNYNYVGISSYDFLYCFQVDDSMGDGTINASD